MTTVKPIYLVALVIAILFIIYIKLSNPYREYSTSNFWKNATVQSVDEIPQQALELGNKNGPVLMWAAIGSSNPKVLGVLQKRGADINEADSTFKGTPLTGAAGYTETPGMLVELVRLGADISKTVGNGETALMIAAQYNQTPQIISTLIDLGARLDLKNAQGKSALDLAIRSKNKTAIDELKSFTSK